MDEQDWLKGGGVVCPRCGQETVRLVAYDSYGKWQVCPSCRPEEGPLFCVYPVENNGASQFCSWPALICPCCRLALCLKHSHVRPQPQQLPSVPLSCAGRDASS